ncbi:MAG: PHP domain-containing protein [Chitinophagaceae bacterium]
MDNYFIADQFSLLSKVLDIHGENSFKSKSYSIASFNIEKLPVQLSEIEREKIFSYKGIGDTIGKKIIEILDTGELTQLKELIFKTPPGVMEMLVIKGIGPKKISTIWKEMEVESLGELLYACNENRLLLYKGFGEKTQKNVQDAIEFYMKSRGSYLYAEAEKSALEIDNKLKESFPQYLSELTGEFKRQLEIITILEWVTTIPTATLRDFFEPLAYSTEIEEGDTIIFKGAEGIKLRFKTTEELSFFTTLVETSCSGDFLEFIQQNKLSVEHGKITSEEEVFKTWNQPYVPAFMRENPSILQHMPIPSVIQSGDIKSIIHCHSTWSDGNSSIEELAKACIASKMEYLVMSDHSKSAFYANGLQEDRIREQQKYIDELNATLTPFKIFKSIECDILNDGSLDYPDNILSTFDLVIASVHSNLKMTEEKAMTRLLRAIENPYTTILGHMTGRLLLSRNGYPVNHKTIIEACAANKVVIELNAHPRRLDMDWRWIDYAIEKGVLISIDPDAHYIHGFGDVKYGVLSAQKAGLTKENNLSSFSLEAFENYLASIRKAKAI